jgi:DNA-binding HxlR family transcriptional regulator
MPGNDYQARVLKELSDGELHDGFNQLRKDARISPEILRECLNQLAAEGFIKLEKARTSPGKEHPGTKDLIKITEKGLSALARGGPERIDDLFEKVKSILIAIKDDPKSLRAWHRLKHSRLVMDGGWDPAKWHTPPVVIMEDGSRKSMPASHYDESYKELNMPARDRGYYTKKELIALEERREDVVGAPDEVLALIFQINQMLYNPFHEGKVLADVIGLDREGHLLRIPVAILKEYSVGLEPAKDPFKDLADHVP